jgi:hypothetical protein
MLCVHMELCLLNLACLNIILILLVGINEKVLKGLGIKISILSQLVIIVALVVMRLDAHQYQETSNSSRLHPS